GSADGSSDVGSGTQWLLRDLFARLANMGQGDALEKMRAGEVGATILTSEQRNKLFSDYLEWTRTRERR
ncbi:MAG TPA: hypothetical protein VLJ17_02405, partial [Xanthobacteraceae bacterium]|nr:hypothetical protein [Xanthobacteraceae bacterium]